ncbi:hypothetical protein niasHT_009611 [Heterodera trifolii]|uniref:Uncharacterized protein n=1 Tax=Heterodera trifolii TaxID=157864 RepID=A0ABD2LU40_9BILA
MFNSGLSSSGCSSDLAKAKLLAHDYVVTYGFSPIGTPPSDPGPAMQNQIDVEKNRVVDEAHLDVTDRLGTRKKMIKIIALALLDEKLMGLINALTEGYVADPVVPPEEYIAVPSDSVMEEYVAGR